MKVHLVGIAGTGMGPFAGLLKAQGHDVRGSDANVYPPMSTQLEAVGVAVMQGFSPANLDWHPDVVVVGNVCSKDHIEVVAAKERNLRLTSFPALLEELFLQQSHAFVVAGTHGKTTTSSLAAAVLADAGKDPSFLIGGVVQNFNRGWQLGKPGGTFVVEGDEYDTAFFDKGSKFLHYAPRTAILTSIELDHVDIFNSLDEIKESFRKFVKLIPADGLLVACAESEAVLDVSKSAGCRVETYSVKDSRGVDAEWQGRKLAELPGGRMVFEVLHKGQVWGVFDSLLTGRYNLANMVAVAAACANLGLDNEQVARGLRRFAGVRRRQEVRGVAQGVTVVDDFAHHPTAVHETLTALRNRHGNGRLIAIFEPRSATSRRAVFQKEYGEAFTVADEVIIGAVDHPEKAPENDRFNPEALVADLRGRGIMARHIPNVDKIVDELSGSVAAGDTIVIMSSGGFGDIHNKLLTKLGDAVTPGRTDDISNVGALMERTGLQYPDLPAHEGDLLVIRDGHELAACVALELYDDSAVLRALATQPERRGNGLGWMLADAALNRARNRGCKKVYLVTESASDFFAEKFGFRTVSRELTERSVLKSSQFQNEKPGAVTMVLALEEAPR